MSCRLSTSADGPATLDRQPPRLGALVGVGRPDHLQPGHGPQGGQVLDRLVGRAVLAEPDRVVGPRVDDVCTRESAASADRRACSR